MTINSTPPKTQTAWDKPTDIDAFGSHDRIAKAIKQLIENEDGGKTIGLEGDWGSGKSSIIKQLENKIRNNLNVGILIFDAWSHKGDPLRRAFLEEVVKNLLDRNWLNAPEGSNENAREFWQKENEKLSKKRKESSKTTRPIMTGKGKILLTLAFFIPLGNALIGAGIKELQNSALYLIIGIMLSLSPLIALIFFYFDSLCSGKDFSKDFTIFLNKAETTEETTSIDSPEPTTIEFQDIFRKICDNSIWEKDRRLIIVLDNLDRLESSETQEIWSMLRSFIDNPAFEKCDWYRNLWVVVPYAQAALIKKTNENENQETTFLDKILQIKFKVPTPVLSDWKKFLNERILKSIPNASNNGENEKITHLYRLKVNGTNRSATRPRDLIKFVNSLVALDLQWENEIPLSHQALFVILNEENNENFINKLIANHIPSENQINIVEGDIRASLAALAFNIEPDKAAQILLREEISNALNNPDGIQLRNSHKNTKGFPEHLSTELEVLLPDWAKNEPNKLCTAIKSINNSGIVDPTINSSNETSDISRIIKLSIGKLSHWPLNEQIGVDAIRAIANIDKDRKFASTTKESLVRTNIWYVNNGHTSRSTDSQNQANTKKFLQSICEDLVSVDIKSYLYEGADSMVFTMPGDIEQWCLACDFIQYDLKKNPKNYISTTHSIDEIRQLLSQTISQGNFARRHFCAINFHYEESNTESFQGEFITPTILRVSQITELKDGESLWLHLLLLKELYKNPKTKETLQSIFDSGAFHHHIFYGEKHSARFTAILHLMIKIDPALTFKSHNGNSSNGNNLIISFGANPDSHNEAYEKLITRIKQYNDLLLPIKLIQSGGQASVSIGKILVKSLIEDKNFALAVSKEGKTIPQTLKIIKESLSTTSEDVEKYTNFLTNIVENHNLEEIIASHEFTDSDIWLHDALTNTKAIRNLKYIDFLCAALKSLNRNEIKDKISQKDGIYKLLCKLNSAGATIVLGMEYRDGLREFAKFALQEESIIGTSISDIHCLLNAIPTNQHKGFTEDVFELTCLRAEQGVNASFLKMFGELLQSTHIFNNSRIDVIRRLAIPMCRHAHKHELEWVLESLSIYPNIIKSEPKENFIELSEILDLVQPENDTYEVSQKIINLINP